ncbi:MAG: hypothetical protein V3U31_04020, partial [Dehalococcoidia bacterium]
RPNIEMRTLTRLPENHVKIFDLKFAWIEEPHPHEGHQDYREGYIVRGPDKVSGALDRFESSWQHATATPPALLYPNNDFKGAQP